MAGREDRAPQLLARLYPGVFPAGIVVGALANAAVAFFAAPRHATALWALAGCLETLAGAGLIAYGLALRADWSGLVDAVAAREHAFPAPFRGDREARCALVRCFGLACLVCGAILGAVGLVTLAVKLLA